MNQKERTEVEVLADRVAGCELACNENAKSTELVRHDVAEIKDNHIPHLKAKIDLMFKVIAWGLALIAIMLGGLGALIAIINIYI